MDINLINLININAQIWINIAIAILVLIFGYIMGSIPTSVWIGKIFYHQDPRDFGSHNAGGTNAGRLWGKRVGFTIIVLDMIKTVAPIWIVWAILTFVPMFEGKPILVDANNFYNEAVKSTYLIQWPVYWLAPLGCILGHCFPLFANFKGGKGAAGFMGTIVMTSWFFGGVPGIIYFGILKWKKYVSLTAILIAIISSLFAWLWVILVATKAIPSEYANICMYGPTLVCDWVCATVITLMAAIVILRHHENINRLITGTERKIKWMK